MAKLQKNLKINVKDIVIDRTRNIREQDDSTYRVDALMEDISLRGQLEPVTLERVKEGDTVKYYPIRGFLRSTAITALALAGVIDPTTAKRDDKGEIIPGTGNVFEFVKAEVYEELTERERANLLVDIGQRRGLTKVELHFAMERLFAAMYSEKEVAVLCRSMLEQWYNPGNKIEEPVTPEKLLNYFRGVIQTAKEAWRGPKLMRDAWVAKLRGTQSWPTKAEMMDGVKIYKKAVDEDKTGRINRDEPGEKFMEFWTRLTTEQANAARGNAPKPVSMASRGQVEDMQKVCDSRIIKTILSIVLNDGKVDRGKLPNLDAFLKDIEKNLSEEQTKILDSVYTV